MTELSSTDLTFLRQFVHQRSGNVVGEDRMQLMSIRLFEFAKAQGMRPSIVLDLVRSGTSVTMEQLLIGDLLNGETYFFRDPKVFIALREHVLPRLLERRTRSGKLVFWSAACSTGQEPYSLAMLLDDAFPDVPVDAYRILATDLSDTRLAAARRAVYGQHEINRGLPARFIPKYFESLGTSWEFSRQLRNRVDFLRANLLEPLPMIGFADIVLLRNVLIYFDDEARVSLLERIAHRMVSGATLVLGSAELARGLETYFVRDSEGAAGIYHRL